MALTQSIHVCLPVSSPWIQRRDQTPLWLEKNETSEKPWPGSKEDMTRTERTRLKTWLGGALQTEGRGGGIRMIPTTDASSMSSPPSSNLSVKFTSQFPASPAGLCHSKPKLAGCSLALERAPCDRHPPVLPLWAWTLRLVRDEQSIEVNYSMLRKSQMFLSAFHQKQKSMEFAFRIQLLRRMAV